MDSITKFIDREGDLKFLEDAKKDGNPELIVIYGRRRVGKTELIRKFIEGDAKNIYIQFDMKPETEIMREIGAVIGEKTGDAVLIERGFEDWDMLFRYLGDLTEKDRWIVAFDEFPFACQINKAVPSILQKHWDSKLKNTKLLLILCGSSMGMMRDIALSYQSPLYGRRTGSIYLEPLNYANSRKFFPGQSEEEKITAYAILGGTPEYLRQFDSERTIKENLKNKILNKRSFFYREPEYLLLQELKTLHNYFGILEAISFGKQEINELSQFCGLKRSAINKYIQVLDKNLGLVTRRVPATERNPGKSKMGRYFLRDNLFKFWFRFVHPNKTKLELEQTEIVLKFINENLAGFTGRIFEEVVKELLMHYNNSRIKNKNIKFDRIGSWWNRKGNEIDICAVGKQSLLLGEVKWTNTPVRRDLVESLLEKSKLIQMSGKREYVVVSKSGFTENAIKLMDEKGMLWLTLEDVAGLYGRV